MQKLYCYVENNTFIRLADALCGLVRDVEDGQEWASEMLRRLEKKKAVPKKKLRKKKSGRNPVA